MTTFSEDHLQHLFQSGRFASIVASADNHPHEIRRLPPISRLTIAHAMLYAGSPSVALSLAKSCESDATAPDFRARAELVLGLIAKRNGEVDEAIGHLRHSVRLAQGVGEHEQACWSQLHLLRLLAEGHPPEVLAAALAGSRRMVTRVGNPHLAAFLHDSVAFIEGRTGRVTEAKRHIEIERSILERHPNAWLEQLMHINASCLAILNCNFESAANHSRTARKLGDLTGAENARHVIDLNDAHIYLFSGQFERAANAFSRIAQGDRALSRVAALDGLARLYLATNRLDECDAAVRRALATRSERGLATFYAGRWIALVLGKLLIRQDRVAEAVSECQAEIEKARLFRDQPFEAALHLLSAEALSLSNDFARAGSELLRSSHLGITEYREYAGHYYESCHQVLRSAGSALAPTLRSRAFRIWKREQNVWALTEASSRGQAAMPLKDIARRGRAIRDEHVSPILSEPSTMAAYILGSIRAALDFSLDSSLAITELLGIADALGCRGNVASAAETANASIDRNASPEEATYNVRLGSTGASTLRIALSPSSDPLKNVAMADLMRIAQAVEEISRAREEKRNSAALWPADEELAEDAMFASDEMITLAATARKVGPTPVTVLITGETGTGKEILARAIHAASPRATATFLPFNCSAGPRDMIDTQLFGHRRGAFTGATEHAPGVVRGAAGGTLFLDEIGEAPLEVQPKLLRFLESGEIHPIGEPHPVKVDVRVIAATNVDLDAAVSSGRFREDLFYRLNIVRMHIPPLRERRVEVPIFAQHYLRKHARELGKGDLRLAEETMEYLLLYKWPGNVRQLANEMRRLAALAEADAVLMPEHLSSEIVASRRTVPASERTLDANEVVVRLDQPWAAACEHLERAMLPYALKQCGGRVEDAARMLGLSRKGLYLKRVRLGLELPGPHARTA